MNYFEIYLFMKDEIDSIMIKEIFYFFCKFLNTWLMSCYYYHFWNKYKNIEIYNIFIMNMYSFIMHDHQWIWLN